MAEAEPITTIERPSPLPEDLEEGLQPSDLPYFEDDFFDDFGNTSKYSCQKKPPVLATHLEPLDKKSLRESIRELTAIMNSEWVEEAKRYSEEIQIRVPPSIIRCKVLGIMVDVFTHLLSEQI